MPPACPPGQRMGRASRLPSVLVGYSSAASGSGRVIGQSSGGARPLGRLFLAGHRSAHAEIRADSVFDARGGCVEDLPLQRVQGLKVMDGEGAGASGATGECADPVFG